eukprot:COSAG05_NODE_364_length_10775_cov_3.222836_4_plen_53_part_00
MYEPGTEVGLAETHGTQSGAREATLVPRAQWAAMDVAARDLWVPPSLGGSPK